MDGTNQVATDSGTVADSSTAATNNNAPARVFATRDEAVANKPANAANTRPFEVRVLGQNPRWIWGRGGANAIEQVARLDGYTATTGWNAAPLTKETIAAGLARFTDAELAAMGLSRKPQRSK
jgi:hypothetical protein